MLPLIPVDSMGSSLVLNRLVVGPVHAVVHFVGSVVVADKLYINRSVHLAVVDTAVVVVVVVGVVAAGAGAVVVVAIVVVIPIADDSNHSSYPVDYSALEQTDVDQLKIVAKNNNTNNWLDFIF